MSDRQPLHFEFRPLVEADLPCLHEWIGRPHVAEWWREPSTLAQLREDYFPRCGTSTRAFLPCLNGVPVGFVQAYVVMADQASGWWTDERDPNAIGIDQFLADGENLGRGIGTEMVGQFTALIFADAAVTKIQTDPMPTNLRAIRCYEKAGFVPVEVVETPDGLALLMVLARERAPRPAPERMHA